MKNYYLRALALIICSFYFTISQAQQRIVGSATPKKQPVVTSSFIGNTTADCDTINFPFDTSWHLKTYSLTDSLNNFIGYISGTNVNEDRQKANFFDLSSTAYTYISGVRILFTVANSNKPSELGKTITIRLYRDNAGQPGTQIANANLLYSTIKDSVDAGNYNTVNFASPVALPAGKNFMFLLISQI